MSEVDPPLYIGLAGALSQLVSIFGQVILIVNLYPTSQLVPSLFSLYTASRL